VEEVHYTTANMQMKTSRNMTRAWHIAYTRHAIYKTPTLISVEVVARFKIFTAVMNILEVMVYEVSTNILQNLASSIFRV
jgi:hypothetical protein